MDDSYFYEPALGHGLPHDPFKAIVAPRPIGWISSCDVEGRVNLAPYSFFNAICSNPPMVAFSSEGWKDSVANVDATGEFVANFPSRGLAQQMNETSRSVAAEIDEMQLAGLRAAPSRLIKPPRVAEAPAALECRLLQIIELKDLEGRALKRFLTIGQVVGVHIDPRFLKDGIFDTAAADPMMRAGYRGDYAVIDSLFEMLRPG